MNQHSHHSDHHHKTGGRQLHRDWRVWLGVVAMLAAMLLYVFSDSEALQSVWGAAKPKPTSAPAQQ